MAGTWGYQRWHDGRLWESYLARLRAQPGIVITEIGERDGKWLVAGLARSAGGRPASSCCANRRSTRRRVVTHWQPYQSLDPQFVLKRAQDALAPPATVTLAVEGDRIVAAGSAPSTWIQRARASSRTAARRRVRSVDLSQVRDLDEADERLWEAYVARLRAEPGIAITEIGKRDGKWLIGGLRDPLAADPELVLREPSIDPARVVATGSPTRA